MRLVTAGAIAGVTGGLLVTAAMYGGRRAGALEKTLAEESEDWLDEKFDTRKRIGDAGTTVVEQTDHLLASAAFGIAYSRLRSHLSALPWLLLGAGYGATMYAVNIVGIAPLIGLTRGEHREPARVIGQRFGMHVLFGTAVAFGYELLTGQRHKSRLQRLKDRT